MVTKTTSPKPWKPVQIPRLGKPGSVDYRLGNILEQRPEHAQLVGLIVLTWGGIERQIAEMFSYIPDASNWQAALEISRHRNFQPKIAATLGAVRNKFGAQAESAVRKVLRRASGIKKERDNIAHSMFMLRSTHPDAIIRVTGWGRETRLYAYTTATLQALLDELYAIEGDLAPIAITIMFHHKPEVYASGRLVFPQPVSLGQILEIAQERSQSAQPPPPGDPSQIDAEDC